MYFKINFDAKCTAPQYTCLLRVPGKRLTVNGVELVTSELHPRNMLQSIYRDGTQLLKVHASRNTIQLGKSVKKTLFAVLSTRIMRFSDLFCYVFRGRQF